MPLLLHFCLLWLHWGLWPIYSSSFWKAFTFFSQFPTIKSTIFFPEICDLSGNFWSEAPFAVLQTINGGFAIDQMTINLLVWSTIITHHWWSWSTMQSTSFSSRFFNFLQSFHTEVWTVHRINRILLFSPQILVKSFACNIIIDSSYNLSKYIQYKHVWKLFEVGCQHQHTLIPLYCLDRNRKLLRCLRILITAVYFKDRKWNENRVLY